MRGLIEVRTLVLGLSRSLLLERRKARRRSALLPCCFGGGGGALESDDEGLDGGAQDEAPRTGLLSARAV